MVDFEIIAERRLLVRDKDGDRALVVQIGKPYWVEPGIEAACPVSIDGLFGRLRDMHGVDTFQAMECAMSLVNSLLSPADDGRKILWPDGQEYP